MWPGWRDWISLGKHLMMESHFVEDVADGSGVGDLGKSLDKPGCFLFAHESSQSFVVLPAVISSSR